MADMLIAALALPSPMVATQRPSAPQCIGLSIVGTVMERPNFSCASQGLVSPSNIVTTKTFTLNGVADDSLEGEAEQEATTPATSNAAAIRSVTRMSEINAVTPRSYSVDQYDRTRRRLRGG